MRLYESNKLSKFENIESTNQKISTEYFSLKKNISQQNHGPFRPKSPEGFWRTDFPTTQEVLKEREEAERTRQKVAYYRLKEAVINSEKKINNDKSCYGRFIFRDISLRERFSKINTFHK